MTTKYIALPDGVSEKDFDKAIARFRKILGDEYVLTDAEQLAPNMKIMLPVDIAQHTPSAAILPKTVKQIQKILKVCNKYKVPV